MKQQFILRIPHQRRGVTAALVAIMLPVLLGVAALTVDIGSVYVVRAQMQDIADAGALAGASALRDQDHDSLYSRADDVIARNKEAFGFSSLSRTIVVGRWDPTTLTFTPTSAEEIISANAVRVQAVRPDSPLFFAGVMNKHYTSIDREAIAMVRPSCAGLWGLDDVTVPGSVSIDSYDSTDGAYSAGSAEADGDVCSNGPITVQGSATINGDVLSASGDVTIVGGSATITGIHEQQIEPILAPVIDFGDALANNNNDTIGLTDAGTDPLDNTNVSTPGFYDLILNDSENLTLAPGTYIFDDLILKSHSSLTLTGPTTIYLDDDLDIAGSAVFNTTQNPADLMIIVDGDVDGSTIELSGNSEFYGAILAPNSTIKLSGTADFYGNIIGGTVDFKGNFGFHVDKSLSLVNVLKGWPVLVK